MRRRRPPGALLLLAALAGCGSGAPVCRDGTLLLVLRFDPITAAADQVVVDLVIDGQHTSATKMRTPGGSLDTVEVDFPAGYPSGKTLAVQLSARAGGATTGTGSAQASLDGKCQVLEVALGGAAGDGAVTGGDQGGEADLARSIRADGSAGDQGTSPRDLAAPPGSDLAAPPIRDLAAPPGSDLAVPPGSDLAAPPGSDLAAPPGSDLAAPPGSDLSASLGTDASVDLAVVVEPDLATGDFAGILPLPDLMVASPCPGACFDAGFCQEDAGRCVACLSDDHCPPGSICGGGACVPGCTPSHGCAGSLACCGGACVDVNADPANCGACGGSCGAGSCCGGTCADLTTDPNRCGGCDRVCSASNATPTCLGGQCAVLGCNAPWSDCDGLFSNGCETDVSVDPHNCGGCGASCSGNHVGSPTCQSGLCVGQCDSGYQDCDGDRRGDGCEVYVAGDPEHCGSCGVVCSGNHIGVRACDGGFCDGACDSGWGDCNGNKQIDGCETAINVASTDPANCGGCGVACSSNNIPAPACSGGQCVGACATGTADCDGSKLGNGCETVIGGGDVANCGGCGIACSQNHLAPSCSGAVCGGSCAGGYADCDGNLAINGCETDLLGDAANCGACGHACTFGQCQDSAACVGGGCVPGNKGRGASCDDGDPCTANDTCDGSGGCAGTPYSCTPTQCQSSSVCDGAGGCTIANQPGGTGCDDGNLCTWGDACDGNGACVGTAVSCANSPCIRRTCNGTSSCTVTNLPRGAVCGGCHCGEVDCDGLGTCSVRVGCLNTTSQCP